MDFKNNKQLQLLLTRLKEDFHYILIGIAVIAAFGAGFVLMVGGILFAPFIRLWKNKKLGKNPSAYNHVRTKTIEAEYEVIEDEEK